MVLQLILHLLMMLLGLWHWLMAAISLLVLYLGNIFQGLPYDLPGLEVIPSVPNPPLPLPMGIPCRSPGYLINFSDSESSDTDSDASFELSNDLIDSEDSETTITNDTWKVLPFPGGLPTSERPKLDLNQVFVEQPTGPNIPTVDHHCGNIFKGMNTLGLTYVRDCLVTNKVKNNVCVNRTSYDYMSKFQCDWDSIMKKLWPLTNDFETRTNKEKGITTQNAKNRLILIVLTVLRDIMPVTLEYFQLLDWLLWLFVCEFITSFQIYWIFLDIWYLSQCDGNQFMAIEDEIISLVLWHIASNQNRGWFQKQLNRVYKDCADKQEYYSMVVQRMTQLDKHKCVCPSHLIYPPIPGPSVKPTIIHYGDVMIGNSGFQNNTLDISRTDRKYVDILEYLFVMYSMNVPHHGTLGGEEDILWNSGMIHHKGFDTQNWDLLDLLLKIYKPDLTDDSIEKMKSTLDDLKKSVCPCRIHKTMRSEEVINTMRFPLEWSACELKQVKKNLLVLKYSTDKKFIGNIYHVPTPPKIQSITSTPFVKPGRNSRPSRPKPSTTPRPSNTSRPSRNFRPPMRSPIRYTQRRTFNNVRRYHRRCRLQ